MASKMAVSVLADHTNQLQVTDLAELIGLLKRHGYSGVSYYDLGLFLDLSPNTISVIEADHRGDTGRCLRECLTKWLQKADDVQKKGGPSIYSLVSALRELGENAVANGIDMEKHPACKILACYTSNQSLVSELPQMAQFLHSEMHINETVCVKKEKDILLIEIVKAVCIDSNMLEVFAGILLQYKSTVIVEIGNTIMREYRKAYFCDETKDDNAKQDEIYLPPSITSKFKSMRMKLSFTFDKIIKACPPSTFDKIKNLLRYYSEDLKPQVAQCQKIHDILDLVRRNCSLDDIEMLKAIVNELNIEEAKKAIQEYSEALEEFSETELSECLNEKFSYASPLQCERITIVVDQNTDDCTLNDVRRLSANTFHKLSPQNSRRIKLNVIRDGGSFTITCSFPLILSEQLITAALNNIDVLKENKVKRLTIGYCTVYEVKDTSTTTTTEIDENTSSLSTSSGLMKQLMLSLSVQLINSTEEVTALNEENKIMKKEAESLKEVMDTKRKMLSASIAESESFNKRRAAETKLSLQEEVSCLKECKEENEKLKKILLEVQLTLCESEEEQDTRPDNILPKDKKQAVVIEELAETIKAKNQLHKEANEEILAQLAKYEEENEGLIQEADETRQILDETKNKLQNALIQKNEIINEKEKLAESEKVLKKKLLSLEKDMKTMKLENDQLQSEKEKVIALGKSKIRQLQENVKMSKRTVAYGGPHLTIADLALVDDLLTRHGFTITNCFKLGLQLGLITNTLDVIETQWNGDASRCLLECLKQWLKLADDVKSKGGTTIPVLIKALRKIGETATANGICNETHPACSILKQYISDQSVVEGLPQLALSLYKEGIIGTMMAPAGARGVEVLLTLIQESVCADHQNLEKFATILQQFSSTAAIGTLIRKDYIEKIFDDITQVHNKIEFQPIRATYAKAVTNARSAMIAIPSDDLKKFLCRGYPYLIPELEHTDTTDDILYLVCSRRCSIVNVSQLEEIACYFKVEEAIIIIEKYQKSLQEFKPLRMFLDEELFSGSNLESEMISFIIDGNFDDYTLQDIQQLLQYAFKELAPHVMIKVIREHTSFIVICSFPLSLSEQLIATAEENIEVLKDKGVKKLTIGYCTLYDNENVSNFDTGAQDEELQTLPSIDENDKLEQLMFSQNLHLINREQELIHQSEIDKQEIQKLQAQVEQLSNDEAHIRLKEIQDEYDTLLKENEKLHQEVSTLRRESYMYSSQRKQSQLVLKQDPNPIVFQDDIYGEIVIEHPLIKKIVKTRQFQRLKDIKKLGYTYLNIPKASYSRFQHSIGMYYLAGKYVKQLRKRQPELNITHSEVLCVQIAALCYNLGVGPFSHIFQLFLNEVSPKPWERISEASVLMFDYMIKENDEVKILLEELLDDNEEDIAFIKDLIHDAYGTRKGQHKGKEFLYEIVVNKTSGLDVCMIDHTTRDAAVLGMNTNFKWREFLSKVEVKVCENGERHIFFQEDDLDTYNDLFRTRHSLFRELYYLRKNRIAALMITRILVKSSDIPIIRDGDRRVTLYEATKNMSAYSQLSDGALNVIKSYVDDLEVQHLLSSLESMKFIGQIGFVKPADEWDKDKIKQHILKSCPKIGNSLIIDPIKSGYENHVCLSQYYYTTDRKSGQWTDKWAYPPENIYPIPVRIFLVTGDRDLIQEVQEVLAQLLEKERLIGGIYHEQENFDLMPPLPPPVLPNV